MKTGEKEFDCVTDRLKQLLLDELEKQCAAHTNLESRIAELAENMKCETGSTSTCASIAQQRAVQGQIADCGTEHSNMNAQLQDLEARIRTKHAELIRDTASRSELEEIHKRLDQLHNSLDEERVSRDSALQTMKGELLSLGRVEKCARETIEERMLQRLAEFDADVVKHSELNGAVVQAENRLQQVLDDQKRARDGLETTLQDFIRKEHAVQQSLMQEQWDREQKARLVHNEQQRELMNKERAEREASAQAQERKIEILGRKVSRMDSIDSNINEDKDRLWNALQVSALHGSVQKEFEMLQDSSMHSNTEDLPAVEIRCASPSTRTTRVRGSSPPLQRPEWSLVHAGSGTSHAPPSRTVSIPLFSANKCGVHTPSTVATTAAASNESQAGCSSVECQPLLSWTGSTARTILPFSSSSMVVASHEKPRYYATRAASPTYMSLKSTSLQDAVASTKPATSARRLSPTPSPEQVVCRSRSCTLPEGRKMVINAPVAHTDPAEFPW